MKPPELLLAVMKGDTARVQTLLKGGASADVLDRDGRTPLFQAVVQGRLDIASELVNAGARVTATDKAEWTPLHMAAQWFRVTIGELLLKAGANVDAQDEDGNTPLWRAVFASRGRGEMIEMLLAHGADKSVKNGSGISPYELAGTISNYDIRRYLPA